MKNRRPIMYVLISLALVITGINILLSAKLADAGDRLSDLATEQHRIQNEINNLNKQTVQTVALIDLKMKAQTLGYAPVEHFLELKPESPLAFRR